MYSSFHVASLLTILRSRATRLAVLAFQLVWLNAIVPGHRRGAVELPGESCPTCQPPADACCPEMSAQSVVPHKPRAPVSKDPAAHCAICYFAAMLSTPPAIEPVPLVHRLLQTRTTPGVRQRATVPFLASYDGRAPPAGSFLLV